jgi:cytochrome c-type biogenesis protein CcmH/NrfG
MVELFRGSSQEPKDPAKTATTSKDAQLKEQARGYEQVLQQEPKNQFALEELAKVRIQMRDAKGAVEPLEKLVKLNPDRADYKAALAQVKQQANKERKVGDR